MRKGEMERDRTRQSLFLKRQKPVTFKRTDYVSRRVLEYVLFGCSFVVAVAMQHAPAQAERSCVTALGWQFPDQILRLKDCSIRPIEQLDGVSPISFSASPRYAYKLDVKRTMHEHQIFAYLGRFCEVIGAKSTIARVHQPRRTARRRVHFSCENSSL
ncbi:MAG: hypothetical protein ABJL67_03600 [Sulfitobacter sp.]